MAKISVIGASKEYLRNLVRASAPHPSTLKQGKAFRIGERVGFAAVPIAAGMYAYSKLKERQYPQGTGFQGYPPQFAQMPY